MTFTNELERMAVEKMIREARETSANLGNGLERLKPARRMRISPKASGSASTSFCAF